MKNGKVGKYKIAYWSDGATVSSEMFDDMGEAQHVLRQREEKGELALLMENMGAKEGKYRWKVQKGGVGSFFTLYTTLYSFRWPLLAIVGYYIIVKKTGD